MKQKIIAAMMTLLLVIGLTPVFAISTGDDIDIDFETEDFAPRVYISADSRVVSDDDMPTGRGGAGLGADLSDVRTNNYAFEGENIFWSVLVHDRNGIETAEDPVVTVGPTQTEGNPEEVSCDVAAQPADGDPIPEFNVRDGPDLLDFNVDTMRLYDCELTVESPASMAGEFWVSAEVTDSSGATSIATQNEFWFFNPTIALDLDGAIDFGTVRPGATSYSSTLTIENDAEEGSGVLLEMFISGTDFTDPTPSAAKCPTTNELDLENFGYLAVNGAHSSALENVAGDGDALDAEGYDDIPNGDRITESREMIGGDDYLGDGDVSEAGNVLAPGAEVSLTLKLELPEPCNGDFTDGSIFFWAEAV